MDRASHVFFAIPCCMRETPVRHSSPPHPSVARLRASPGRRRPRWFRSQRAALLMASLVMLAGCGSDEPGRPDLFLITIDALGTDQLGCFGGDADAGASVCALGQEGTLFAWATAPDLGEASAAGTVLTGLPRSIHGVHDDGQSFLRSRHETIAETLSSVGYRTAAFVAAPRLNRSRRLDQGFDQYEDATVGTTDGPRRTSAEFAQKIQAWLEHNPSPRFVWIHADRAEGLREFDRLLSRLSQPLASGEKGAGLLFAGLRGEAQPGSELPLGFPNFRIPLLWRPPHRSGATDPRVSLQLTGLMDIAPTLRAAARVPLAAQANESTPPPAPGPFEGRSLSLRLRPPEAGTPPAPRYIFLEAVMPSVEVGLAAERHVYVRGPSAGDGSGRPVATESLKSHAARFAALPIHDPLRHAAPRSAGLDPGPWREDVLDAQSPVSRLEFHLARRLNRTQAERAQTPR